jgi:hypothetical protein
MLTREFVYREQSIHRRNSGRQFSRLRKYLKQSAIALLAFILAAALLNQIIPSPLIPSNVVFVSPKYAHYSIHKNEYNALFFGSSRIYNQVAPEIFDQVAKDHGLEINSFNFGIPAMRAVPGYVLLRDVLRQPPKNLKWVFIETPLDNGYEPIQNARATRSIYWHTVDNTRLAIDYILKSNESLPEKIVLIGSHIIPFFYHQTNVGRLFSDWLSIHKFTAEEKANSKIFLENEGYFPLHEEDMIKPENFQEYSAAYEATLEQVVRQNAHLDTVNLERNKQDLIDKIVQTVKAAGAVPIFVIPPTLEPQAALHHAYRVGQIPELLAFNDPEKYPELYALSYRYDTEHLTDAGSKLFSRFLAQAFTEANF